MNGYLLILLICFIAASAVYFALLLICCQQSSKGELLKTNSNIKRLLFINMQMVSLVLYIRITMVAFSVNVVYGISLLTYQITHINTIRVETSIAILTASLFMFLYNTWRWQRI